MPATGFARRLHARELRLGLAGASLYAGVTLAVAACGSDAGSGTGGSPNAGAIRAHAPATAADYARERFTHPTRVDNRWYPLIPGTQFVYGGRANRGEGQKPHRVLFTVTDLTKVIDGVRTRVIWDRDVNAGVLQEGELAFMAQDDAGNVWNFGEYPEEYEGGRFHGAPDTWIVGRAGARAGIGMRADPRTRTSSYLQGWAPAIDFADRARVIRTGRRTCVPGRCYRNVLEIDEWNPDEPGAHQSKFYAPGVGNVRVGAAGGDEREVLVLQKVRRLSRGAVAWVRKEALKLEARAYRVHSKLYGPTPPAERDGGTP